MIQRIQTLFLLLASVCFGALFKLPLASSEQITTSYFADHILNINDHPSLLGITVLGALMALFTIFLYKNRRLQMNLVYGLIVLGFLIPLVALLLVSKQSPLVGESSLIHYQPGIFLPIGAIVLGFIASYYIRKDEKLVKSMDRLR